VSDKWTCRTFGLSNAVDDGKTDLPKLLRRLADEIERQGIASGDVLDVTLSYEITGEGLEWAAHVYWSPSEDRR
jgi:hypothetical protein